MVIHVLYYVCGLKPQAFLQYVYSLMNTCCTFAGYAVQNKTQGRKTVRKHLALVTAVLTVIIMITGCAETPETVSVMKKDIEQMIETANSLDDKSATVNKQVNAPEVCRKSYRSKDGILEVNIDADVIVPNAETSRIIRVAAHEITQNEVDKWTDFLFHGEDLYDIACFSEMTRPEMEEYIIELKHALAVVSGEGEQIAYSEVAADGKNLQVMLTRRWRYPQQTNSES